MHSLETSSSVLGRKLAGWKLPARCLPGVLFGTLPREFSWNLEEEVSFLRFDTAPPTPWMAQLRGPVFFLMQKLFFILVAI